MRLICTAVLLWVRSSFVRHFRGPAPVGLLYEMVEGAMREMLMFPLSAGPQSTCFHGTYKTITPEVPVLVRGDRTSTH